MALLCDICPLVRPTDGTYGYVARGMDTGALGVIVPRVDSAEQAAAIVSYVKYPPVGRRGAGGDGRNGYLKISPREAAETSNAESLVVLQIESREAVDNVDAIAATEGVDVLLIGPQDLSVSLGFHGDFSHPAFLEAAHEVVNACKKHGKASGMVEREPAAFRRWHDMGMRFLVCDSDSNMLYYAALRDVAALNEFVAR
jgi:2-keto-3-deoxy-L-rhamnonate aldolase RhmA